MSSDESRVRSWGNQQEESVPPSPSLSPSVSSPDCREVFTPIPLNTINPSDVGRTKKMNSGGEGNRTEEESSEGDSGENGNGGWGASSYRSTVTSDMLATWRGRYAIPRSVEMMVPEPADRANAPPQGCIALNSAILSAGLRLPFPRVIRRFLSSWGIAPTQLCPNGWRTLIATLILWAKMGNPEMSVG